MAPIRLLTIAVIGLLALNIGLVGFLLWKSNQSPRPGGPPGEGPQRLIIERLHLDQAQQRQYGDLVNQHRQQTRQFDEQGVRLYRQYYQLLKTTAPDTTRSAVFSQQIADNQRAIAELNFAHFSALKVLCRPDQQADFARLVDDLTELFGRKSQSGRVGRPPHGADGPPNGPPQGPPENYQPRP